LTSPKARGGALPSRDRRGTDELVATPDPKERADEERIEASTKSSESRLRTEPVCRAEPLRLGCASEDCRLISSDVAAIDRGVLGRMYDRSDCIRGLCRGVGFDELVLCARSKRTSSVSVLVILIA
jgi:hypothetical protein